MSYVWFDIPVLADLRVQGRKKFIQYTALICYGEKIFFSFVAAAREYFNREISPEGHYCVKTGRRLTASKFGEICKAKEVDF